MSSIKARQLPNDDIDLLVLVEKSLSFFGRYKWIFIVAIILGIGSGVLVYKWLPKVYTSRLVLHSFILTNPEQIQLVNNWSRLLSNREFETLASTFNTKEEILRPIKRIKAEEIQKVFTTDNPNGFYIEVTVSDNSILKELQQGILHAFRNGEYINARISTRKAMLNELIQKTSIEIDKLDSTKAIMERIIRGESRNPPSMILDGSSINRQLIEMNERLLNYKSELQFAEAVQVLQGFDRFDKPKGPKLIPWLVISLVFFLSLAWAFAIIHSVRNRLKIRALFNPNS